jgi:hypothetical protein
VFDLQLRKEHPPTGMRKSSTRGVSPRIWQKYARAVGLSIGCLLTLIAGRTTAYAARDDLDPKVAGPLERLFDRYQDGGVGDKEFASDVDKAYARLADSVEKAQFLQRVVDFLPGMETPSHDADALELRYAAKLAEISDQPDVVADALMHEGTARHDKAQSARGEAREALLISALKCYIACSKIVAANLVNRTRESPAVDPYDFEGDTDSAEYRRLVANHAAQEARRAFDDQQNNMLEDCELLNKEAYRHLVDELHLSNGDFAKIWTGVEWGGGIGGIGGN